MKLTAGLASAGQLNVHRHRQFPTPDQCAAGGLPKLTSYQPSCIKSQIWQHVVQQISHALAQWTACVVHKIVEWSAPLSSLYLAKRLEVGFVLHLRQLLIARRQQIGSFN